MKAQYEKLIKELGGREEEVKALLNKMAEKLLERSQGSLDLRRKNFYRIISSAEEVLKQNY